MTDYNPGPATTDTPNITDEAILSGTYLSTNLPPANAFLPGRVVYTSDQGLMVTSGTAWSALVSAGTPGSAGVAKTGAATYAAARLLTGSVTGDTLYVFGRTSQSDGGQGLFTWVAGGTTSVNDGTQLQATGGIWQRSPDSILTPGMGTFDPLAAGIVIDAGLTTDLTAVIAEAVAVGECTVVLRKHDYTWPAGTKLPNGMSIIGQGWDGTHAATAGVGSLITTTDQSIIVQDLNPARGTIIKSVYFKWGLQVRKQRTHCFNVRFDGNGLIVGDHNNTCSPYYSHFIACHFDATDPGGTPITLQNFCNGVDFDGSLFVSPGGRGIYFQDAVQGNRFRLTQDYGGASSADIKSIVYFGGGAIANNIEFTYWEDSAHTGRFTDGGHIVFGVGSAATRNRILIPTNGGNALRVVHNTGSADNYVETTYIRDSEQDTASFNWDYAKPDTVMTGGANVYLPPTTLRRGTLKLLPVNPTCTVNRAYRLTAANGAVTGAVTINNAGSGGVTGTYTQSISDGNTVALHDATVMITVSGGIMTAATLVYPGWWTTAGPATSFAVTVGSLVGATLTLTVTTDDPTSGRTAATMVAALNKQTTFIADAVNNQWRMYPFLNETVVAYGNTGAASAPNCQNNLVTSWTQNANTVWGVPTNPPIAGTELIFLVTKDATANVYTVGWNAVYRNAPTFSTIAGASCKATYVFKYDGTNWQFIGGSTAFA